MHTPSHGAEDRRIRSEGSSLPSYQPRLCEALSQNNVLKVSGVTILQFKDGGTQEMSRLAACGLWSLTHSDPSVDNGKGSRKYILFHDAHSFPRVLWLILNATWEPDTGLGLAVL